MKLSKESIVLYSVSLLKGHETTDREFRKEQLAMALGISPRTLDLYLGHLKDKGLVNRMKKRYIKDLGSTTIITGDGRKQVQNVHRMMRNLLLTEKRHNVPSCMDLGSVMEQIADPMDKVFFLSLYNHHKYFDLPLFFRTMRMSKDDTNLLNIFKSMEPKDGASGHQSFVESFHNASLFGELNMDQFAGEEWDTDNIDAMIILAQAKIRSGKFEDAAMIHEYLLGSAIHLTQNQWFMIKIDQSLCLRKSGREEEALELLERLEEMVDNRLYLAFIKQRKGMMLFFRGNREEGLNLLDSAVRSFSTFGLPIFISIALNNRGVARFVMKEYDVAKNDWMKARRYANEAKSIYAEALILPNMADIAIMEGKFDLARKHLDKADSIFKMLKDLEGEAVIMFNMALLKLEMGDLEDAISLFR
ncbi:MAG: tetratricopeptide repeat protein, partial [Thermoplasmatota archaeon]